MPVIAVDTNTVTAADTYFETRLNNATWSGATSDDKLAALTTASNMLDDIIWDGVPYDEDYAFPRYIRGSSTAETPQRVLNALYEQAIHLLKNPSLLFEEETVESLVIGPISLQKIKKVQPFSALVYKLAGVYMKGGSGGAGTWWRAN